ncbi:MAG: hypothetical protein ABSH08_01715 [Tepidisphaeraceae bacterium]|jgi:hypothetical protein
MAHAIYLATFIVLCGIAFMALAASFRMDHDSVSEPTVTKTASYASHGKTLYVEPQVLWWANHLWFATYAAFAITGCVAIVVTRLAKRNELFGMRASASSSADLAALAERFRRTRRVELRAGVVLICAIAVLAICQPAVPQFAFIAMAIPASFLFICASRTPKQICCPACGENQLANRLGNFCPECGAPGLTKNGWFLAATCPKCKRSMRRGRVGRLWKIRVCSHCGNRLDDIGF